MTDLSAIIVTWNSEDYITQCLRSLGENMGDVALEVILVDNNSADRTVEIVKRGFPPVRLIRNPGNFGFARATNQGLKLARGRYLLLLNPDTVVQSGTLLQMVRFMDDNPQVGSLGPQLLNPDGTIQPSCREFLNYQILLWEFTGLSRLFPGHRRFGRWRMGYFNHDSPREVDQPMGACLMLRREALEEVGELDEDFFIFMNDQDLCYRLKEQGWVSYFHSSPKVVHHKGASVVQARERMILVSHKAMYRFLRKHASKRTRYLFLPLFGFLLAVTAVPRTMLWRFLPEVI